MIPRKIHYCWFGGAPKPKGVMKCISSWKKYCVSFQIIEWNEDNTDFSTCPQYVLDAYKNGKWAFVTDYIRLQVVYQHGGIYFDTDVELIRPIDKLLKYKAFFCFEDGKNIATGLGFGAARGTHILKEMMEMYESLPFVLPDGSFNQETCPIINTQALLQHGLVQNDKEQILNSEIKILPSIYMCPINYETGKIKISRKTISIHWFDASWMSMEEREYHEKHRIRINNDKLDYRKHFPNRLLMRVLGKECYMRIKRQVKKER